MTNSNHLYTVEEADFEDLGSAPLADTGDRQTRILYDAIVKAGNTLFPNKQGQVFTLALTSGGLAPMGLNAYYWRNQRVIDGYFNQIDMKALGDAIGPGVHQSIKDGFGGGGLLIGLAAGFIIAKVISR